MEDAICFACIKDKHLRSYARQHKEHGDCKYCRREKQVCPLGQLIDFVEESIRTQYDNPENGLGFIDGEWVDSGHPVLESWDLLYDELELGDEKFIDDLYAALDQYQWCRREFYALSDSDELKFTWDYFKDQVKYRTRYLFYREKLGCDEHIRFSEPKDILDQLGHLIDDLNLVTHLPPGTILCRARWSKKKEKFREADALGPPSARAAKKANRMSPAGIPMFYGAETLETCRAEVEEIGGITTVAEWRLLQAMPVLDLTKGLTFDRKNGRYHCDDFPSIFDEGRREKTERYRFMREFAADVTRATDSDHVDQIDYVPTQIVAEYLRRVYKTTAGSSLLGVRFYSSKTGGKNVTLFLGKENCMPSPRPEEKQYLEFIETSIRHIDVQEAGPVLDEQDGLSALEELMASH